MSEIPDLGRECGGTRVRLQEVGATEGEVQGSVEWQLCAVNPCLCEFVCWQESLSAVGTQPAGGLCSEPRRAAGLQRITEIMFQIGSRWHGC